MMLPDKEGFLVQLLKSLDVPQYMVPLMAIPLDRMPLITMPSGP